MGEHGLSRRAFFKHTLWAVCAAGLMPWGAAAVQAAGNIPIRALGRSSELAAILGLNGGSLAATSDDETAVELVRTAVRLQSKMVIDLVWEEGKAAEHVARALQGNDRKKAVLMTGTDAHDKKDCLRQLEQSLSNLGTGFIDMWMIKEDVYGAGSEYVFSRQGALAAAIEAKEKGLVRHIGFAGRRDLQFLLDMVRGFSQFEAAEVTFDGFGYGYPAFQEKVLPHLLVRNIGTVVSNPIADAQSVGGSIRPDKILYLMWSQLVTTIAPDIRSKEMLYDYAQIARCFTTMPKEERIDLLDKMPAIPPPQQANPSE